MGTTIQKRGKSYRVAVHSGGQRSSIAPYVTGTGATSGATAA
jgi:hypothetical protein